MTCDFIEPISGVVRYNNEVWAEMKEREDIKEEIKLLGEERARRAGSILDTSKDGYYTGEKARPDFVKVKLKKLTKEIFCQNANSTKSQHKITFGRFVIPLKSTQINQQLFPTVLSIHKYFWAKKMWSIKNLGQKQFW